MRGTSLPSKMVTGSVSARRQEPGTSVPDLGDECSSKSSVELKNARSSKGISKAVSWLNPTERNLVCDADVDADSEPTSCDPSRSAKQRSLSTDRSPRSHRSLDHDQQSQFSSQHRHDDYVAPKPQLLPKMGEEKELNIVDYFVLIERIAKVNGWSHRALISVLLPNLNAKCLAIYAQIPTEHCNSYQLVRNRLLLAYDVGPEKLRKAYQAIERKPSENFSDLSFRITSAFDRWITSCGVELTYDAIREQLLMDNLYQALPFTLAVLCRDQNPSTFFELTQLADKFDSARERTFTTNKHSMARPWKSQTEQPKHEQGKPIHNQPKNPPPRGQFRDNRDLSAPPRSNDFRLSTNAYSKPGRHYPEKPWRPDNDRMPYYPNMKAASQWTKGPKFKAPEVHGSHFVEQSRPPRQDARE